MNDLLKERKRIEHYLRQRDNRLSSYSFVTLYAWQDFFEFSFKEINETLCIFAEDQVGRFMYLPPLGKRLTEQTIKECFQYMDEKNKNKKISRIENVSSREDFVGNAFSFFKKSDEFCYYKSDLIAMKGERYKSKRSPYNHFVKNYRYAYKPFEPSMMDDCMALYRSWKKERAEKNRDDIYLSLLEDNEKVHERVLRRAKDLDMIGRVVEVNGQIKAYTFGYSVGNDMFCVLFEIADIRLKGLPTFIFREFCGDAALKPYAFINVMDHFELNEVERTKMSFHPVILLESYVVTRQ
jgi:uncharacterized protein